MGHALGILRLTVVYLHADTHLHRSIHELVGPRRPQSRRVSTLSSIPCSKSP